MSSKDSKPLAYSYIRFSTPEQSKGDSLRRQKEDAALWAAKNDVQIDLTRSFHDLGKSAFLGDHRSNPDRYALAAFLKMVEEGKIPRGSYLIIEALDRLTREHVRAGLMLCLGLIESGIRIVQLSPSEIIYDDKSDEMSLMLMIVELSRGHGESKRKSQMIRKAREEGRQETRERTRYFTGRVPAWLEVIWDRTNAKKPKVIGFKLIPAAKKVLRQIFDLRLKGIGLPSIEKRLNQERTWFPPLRKGQETQGWRESYLKKILRNPACIGIYQPYSRDKATGKRMPAGEPIPDYFPPLIKPEVFYAVQGLLDVNKNKGGQTGKCLNLFRHLARCGYCGGPVAFADHRFLVCDQGRRGVTCARHSIRYDEVESLILANLPDLRPEQVLPSTEEQAERLQALRHGLQGQEAFLVGIEGQIANLVDQVSITSDRTLRTRYETRIKELQEDKETLIAKKTLMAADLRKAEQGAASYTTWQRTLSTLLKQLAKGNDVELRQRLRSHLREFIERIEVFSDGEPYFSEGHLQEAERDGVGVGRQFLEYANARLATKEGRFVRVYFKGCDNLDIWSGVQLAPANSLAWGLELINPFAKGEEPQWDIREAAFRRLKADFDKQTQGTKRAKRPIG